MCDRSTAGLLVHRPVYAASLEYIGKESRRIEQVESGQIHNLDDVLARFADADVEWREQLQPFLASLPRKEAAQMLGLSERAISALRSGQSSASVETRLRLRHQWTSSAGQRVTEVV